MDNAGKVLNVNLDVAGIYVVNLDSRPERWDLFQAGLGPWQAAFGQLPQRFSAVAGIALPGFDGPGLFSRKSSEQRKRSWAGKAGCILSHRNVLRQAADLGLPNVLIAEDDAFLTREMVETWRVGLARLVASLPADWAAVYLCTTSAISPCRVAGEFGGIRLVETTGALGTVAYLVNGRTFSGLLRELPDERSIWRWVARHKTIDRWLSQNLVRFGRVYLFAPSIAGHQTGSSDTSMTQENDYLLDFTLKDLKYARDEKEFLVRKWARLRVNEVRRAVSLLRGIVKGVRGL
jgi:glycosyl transferase, family 25